MRYRVSRPNNRFRYFESLDDAKAFAQVVFERTGVFVCIENARDKRGALCSFVEHVTREVQS